jgi:U3 small nucleolar RNA-associated protein 21
MATSSRIFVKNRALGYVSNHIPLAIRYIERRKESVMVTCIGHHFHTYGSAHLTLLNVSGSHNEDITCLAADKFLVYTASGKEVFAWRMGTQIKHKYAGHDHTVHLLLPFGAHLISIDDRSKLKMWDIKSEDLYTELEFDNKSFLITSIMHPVTYVNKILLGSEQGQIQLWNMHTRK